jgi:ParB/RepB/Spo0J family partition protein
MSNNETDDQITILKLSEVLFDEEFNCREKINPQTVIELGQDIEQNGLTQPVIVMELAGAPPEEAARATEGQKYKLIIGFRRFKAHSVMQLEKIKCIIKPYMPIDRQIVLNLSENLQRVDLNILEEAQSLQPLKDMGYSQQKVMDALSKKRGWVQTRFMLLDLPPEIQQEAANGFLTYTHIRDLYSMDNEEDMFAAVRRIKDHILDGRSASSLQIKKNRKQKSVDQKKLRSKTEIFEMMTAIKDQAGYSVLTRMLAWCAGEISDLEFWTDVQKYYDEVLDKKIQIPPALMAIALGTPE